MAMIVKNGLGSQVKIESDDDELRITVQHEDGDGGSTTINKELARTLAEAMLAWTDR